MHPHGAITSNGGGLDRRKAGGPLALGASVHSDQGEPF